MGVYIIARHRVKDRETFDEYERGIKMLMNAAAFMSDELKFGIKVSLDPHMESSLYERTFDLARGLPSTMFLIIDPERRGSGVSFRQIAFNPAFHGSVIVCVDLDQFILDHKAAIDTIVSFAHRMKKEPLLFGVGARDVKITLTKYEHSNNMRIIHELFHSIAMKAQHIPVPNKGYATFGESTSGMYFLNTMHPGYPELAAAILRAAQQVDLHMYASEYYCAIKASQLGRAGVVVVASKENPIFDHRTEKEDIEAVRSLIREATRSLARTDIAPILYAALSDENVERICAIYDRSDVLLVRDLMLECFEPENQ